MSHYVYHSISSANAFGGCPSDYYELHRWMDRGRQGTDSLLHRMLAHHTQGIQDAVYLFGDTLENSNGRQVPTSLLAQQHIKEDLGFIPTLDHYLELLRCPRWASQPAKLLHRRLTQDDSTSLAPTAIHHVTGTPIDHHASTQAL
jgi:hypothetical protein